MKMEIWDPFTGEIQLNTSRLPQETSLDNFQGISHFKLLSLNHNTELLFVWGEYSGLAISDVWKFRYLSEKWTKIGKLYQSTEMRDSFLVKNISCP